MSLKTETLATNMCNVSKQKGLHEIFFSMAEKIPEHIAVIWYENTRKEISYQDLADCVLKMAQMLKVNGIRENEYIAVSMPKGIWQIISTLAILSVGCTYIPIDIDWPLERKKKICKKVNARILVELSSMHSTEIEEVKNIYADEALTLNKIDKIVQGNIKSSAYVIFTSGTTGEPKGVEITHESAVNTINDINQRFYIGKKDVCYAISELSFDLSVYDIFGMLAAGGTIVIPKQKDRKAADRWLEYIKREKVTVWNSVPAIYEMLLTVAEAESEELPLEKILLSGDWIHKELFGRTKNITKKCLFISLGGATEAAIWSVYYNVEEIKDEWNSIPYGYALSNQKVVVMDRENKECPPGIPGELWIGGVGVAKGYVNEERMTKEKFVFYENDRWYRTGDLVKKDNIGCLEFLGRIDYQIKLNGYRIELEEIENNIAKCDSVERAIVLVTKKNGRKHLAAAIKPFIPETVKTVCDIKNITTLKSDAAKTRGAAVYNFLKCFIETIGTQKNVVDKEMKPLYSLWNKRVEKVTRIIEEENIELKEILDNTFPVYMSIFRGEKDVKELLEYPELNPEYISLESPAVKSFLEKIIRNIREGGRKNRIGILQARTGKIANQLADRTTDQEYILFDTSAAMLERAGRERNTLNQYEYSVIRQGHIENKYVGTCDIVIAVNVLHQFADKKEGLRLSNMMLKRGGKLLIIECGQEDAIALITSYVLEAKREPWNKQFFLEVEEWRDMLAHTGFLVNTAEVTDEDKIEYIEAISKTDGIKECQKDITNILKQNVPTYMRPENFYYFSEFPLNENGKVDRKKILSIIEQQYIDVQDESLFTEAEHKLAGIWKKILGIHSVAKESSFFEAGGDSLAATKLMTELKKQYDTEISLTDIFENPYLEQMALMMEKKISEQNEMIEGEL